MKRVAIVIAALLSFACADEDSATEPACTGGRLACGGDGCVDTRSDPDHCGACGVACAPGEVCSDGSCGTSCGEGLTECAGACVDTDTDDAHCGGCGIACGAAQSCSEGQCLCAPNLENCGGRCVDTTMDAANCGGCGNACDEGESCVSGVCEAATCAAGLTACDGACVDTSTDKAHCGGCGSACGAGETCSGGRCGCAAGFTECGGACVDTDADPAHCGGCDRVCEAGANALGAACADGTCILACAEGFADCNGDPADGCEVELAADGAHCGACGNVCEEGLSCVDGVCCGAEGLVCGGACVDPATDVRHCGACGESCGEGKICREGSCALACGEGLADCNGNEKDGCEAVLTSDRYNCGGCGNACGALCGDASCLSVTAPAFSHLHTCVLVSDGSVWCWGYGINFQLGNGSGAHSPVPVRAGVPTAVEVANGVLHSCARNADGGVTCWGDNSKGQLGAGNTTATSQPQTVMDGDQPLTGAVELALTQTSTCALLSSGQVKCWGDGANGRLGNGSTSDSIVPVVVVTSDGSTPLADVVQIAAGATHVCARTGAGALYCWGGNQYGQLGLGDNGSSTARSVAHLVPASVAFDDVAAGAYRTCARSGGSVWCWGQNNAGQLGDGSVTNRNVPTAVAGLTTAATIHVGVSHTCSVLTDGTARCWGLNTYGQLGDGEVGTSSPLPATVLAPEGNGPWTGLKAMIVGAMHTCAVQLDDLVSCWGSNPQGQLGDGTNLDSTKAVPVVW